MFMAILFIGQSYKFWDWKRSGDRNDTADNNKSYIEFEFEENMISSDNIFNVVLVDSVKALYSPSNP